MKKKNILIVLSSNSFLFRNSGIIKVSLILYFLCIAVILLGTSVEQFENGNLIYFFGKETNDFEGSVLYVYNYMQYLLLVVFFPIMFSKYINFLIDTKSINYILSTALSRFQLLIGNYLSYILLYSIIIFSTNSILYSGLYITTEFSFLSILTTSFLLFCLTISAHAFFTFLIISTKSLNIGSFIYIIYTLVISNLIFKRIEVNLWWGDLTNKLLTFITFLLPPNVLVQSSFPSLFFTPQANMSQIIIISLICVIVYNFLSYKIYSKNDF